MEDSVWTLGQHSRELQELRQSMSGLWDDSASRDIASRYLDPHQAEDARMLAELGDQLTLQTEAGALIGTAQEFAEQAAQYAVAVGQSLTRFNQDAAEANHNADQSARYLAEANATFPKVDDLISQANSTCN